MAQATSKTAGVDVSIAKKKRNYLSNTGPKSFVSWEKIATCSLKYISMQLGDCLVRNILDVPHYSCSRA